MKNPGHGHEEEIGEVRIWWPLWLSVVLLLSSSVPCTIGYIIPLYWLYWLGISYSRFIIVTVFGVVISITAIFVVKISLSKLSKNLSPALQMTIIGISFVTFSLVTLNICGTAFGGAFAGNNHLGTVEFKGQVYHLVQDEGLDPYYYNYLLCECEQFGQLCQCNLFFSTRMSHDRNPAKLDIDSTGEILQVKYGEEIWYEYDGETGSCHSISGLGGTCYGD